MSRNMKINKNIVGYIYIYIMLLFNQSSVFHNIISKRIEVAIGALLVTIVLTTKLYKCQLKYIAMIIAVLLAICCFVQLYTSGVGLAAWKLWTAMLLATYLGVVANSKNMFPNYVKVVYFLAIISLVGYIGSLLFLDKLKAFLYTYQNASTWRIWIGNDFTTHRHYAHGLFLYVINDNQNGRNCGIFTEPGVYQMILNSAMFILLFMKNTVSCISEKKQYRIIIILIITIITTLSTTGIIMMFLMLAYYLLAHHRNSTNNESTKFRMRLISIVVFVICGILADYSVRGNASILSSVVLHKVFSNGVLDLSQGSGDARWGTVVLCLASMVAHPLGIGYTNVLSMLNVSETGYLAAQIMQTGAALGVIPFCFILGWIFYPIFKSKLSPGEKWLFVLMYFNTALAQSREFYPALVMFTVWFSLYGNKGIFGFIESTHT